MDARQYFMLTALCLDTQKRYFATRDQVVKEEAMKWENQELTEMIKAAKRDKSMREFIRAKCPWVWQQIQKAESNEPNLF